MKSSSTKTLQPSKKPRKKSQSSAKRVSSRLKAGKLNSQSDPVNYGYQSERNLLRNKPSLGNT